MIILFESDEQMPFVARFKDFDQQSHSYSVIHSHNFPIRDDMFALF